MAQDITEGLDWYRCSQQTHGSRVPKGVRSTLALWEHSCRGETRSDNTTETRTAFKCSIWRTHAQKYLSMGALGSRLLQVVQDGFARRAQQRQLRVRSRFRVPHVKNFVFPVNVIKTQSDDLARTQSVARQQ